MPRPPIAEKGQKTMPYKVRPGYKIGGFDGKVKIGRHNGVCDVIELTKEQAKYYMNMGAVEIDVENYANNDGPAKGAAAPVDEPSTDGPSDSAAGSTPSVEGGAPAGEPAVGKRKSSL